MKKSIVFLLLIVFYVFVPGAFAQDVNLSSKDDGVLVSGQESDQNSTNDKEAGDGAVESDNDKSNAVKSNNDPNVIKPPDEIVAKTTSLVMFQITKNIKLTPGQTSAVESIIEDYTSKARDLKLSVESGAIDSKQMVTQRNLLAQEEDDNLAHIFNSDQMKVWLNIQQSYQ